MNYVNFALRLRRLSDATITAEVTASPVGERGPVTVALPASLVTSVSALGRGIDLEDLRVLGNELFDCLFPTEIRSLYRAALASLPEKHGLRVQLQTDSPDLAAIPWEFAYDSEIAVWLALDSRTPLVRFYALPFQRTFQSRPAPFKVLIVLAGPSDLPKLDLAAERHHIEASFKPLQQAGQVKIQFLEAPASVDRLQRSLRQDIDVLHYVGHGTQRDGQGALLMEREDRSAHLVLAEEFAILVRRTGLRLICLNACLTGMEEGSLFGGLGPALVQAEVPAVVAMQFAMPDKNALLFTREFYAAIADGAPLDSAITAARIALRTQFGSGRPEWGFPVLFMRAIDGHLWAASGTISETVICATCSQPVSPNARYCGNCGTRLAETEPVQTSTVCANCGHANRPQSRYCASCGESLKPQIRKRSSGVQIAGTASVSGIVTGGDVALTISGGDLVFQQSRPSGAAAGDKHDEPDSKQGKALDT